MKALALLLLAAANAAAACPGLEVADPWIAEAPPGASALAGYATLRNGGRDPVVVDRVTSGGFDSVMLHATVIKDGMAHMEHLERLTVPAGGTVRLAPGAGHLMLMGPKRALKAGDAVKLRLECGASGRSVTFTVRKEQP